MGDQEEGRHNALGGEEAGEGLRRISSSSLAADPSLCEVVSGPHPLPAWANSEGFLTELL